MDLKNEKWVLVFIGDDYGVFTDVKALDLKVPGYKDVGYGLGFTVGEGVVIGRGAMIGNNADIGEYSVLAPGCTVWEDEVIPDFTYVGKNRDNIW